MVRSVQSQGIQFPSDAAVNILSYGANLNDGVTDATDAINQAILENQGNLFYRKTLYFPAGTYLVSNSIFVDAINNEKLNGTGHSIVIQGAGVDYTFIKLRDYSFTDTQAPRPVLSTTEAESVVKGYTNIAFMTSIFNLTVDVGVGNPGAIGIRFIANNQGAVRDVVVKSSDPNGAGYAGIDMKNASIPGPANIKNVKIYGFDYGIQMGNLNYGMTLEDIYINGSKKVGIINDKLIVSARNLITENINGQSLKNIHPDGFFVLVDSKLNGSGNSSIENNGFIFLRNILISGYDHALTDYIKDTVINGNLDEYVSHDIITKRVDQQKKSLNIGNGNVPSTPEPVWTDASKWVSVTDFGYNIGDPDAGPAIQAAIDFMNKPGNESFNVLYFPWGKYNIGSGVVVRGNVQKIIGNYATLNTTSDFDNQTTALFTLETTNYSELFIERLNVYPDNVLKLFPVFLNNSAKDVVLRNNYIGHGKAYKQGKSTGRLFLEDVCALSQVYYTKVESPASEAVPQFDFGNQEVWARQLNTEQRYTHILSDGGQVWILGLKTEEPGTVIHARNGSKVEVLGGTILPSFADIGDYMFVIENSAASISCTEHISESKYNSMARYTNIVRQINNDKIFNFTHTEFPKRNLFGSAIPLYVDYKDVLSSNNTINNKRNDRLFVYPNPSDGSIAIRLPNEKEECFIEIYSITGIRLKEFHIEFSSAKKLNLELHPGSYILIAKNRSYSHSCVLTII